jgi:putative ABC transport system substrate-binding protein
MRRRKFLIMLGATTTWPFVVRAQQSAMPVIGFLNGGSAQGYARMSAAFLKGLGEAGYADGRNVTIAYRWAEGHNDRLPALAAGGSNLKLEHCCCFLPTMHTEPGPRKSATGASP